MTQARIGIDQIMRAMEHPTKPARCPWCASTVSLAPIAGSMGCCKVLASCTNPLCGFPGEEAQWPTGQRGVPPPAPGPPQSAPRKAAARPGSADDGTRRPDAGAHHNTHDEASAMETTTCRVKGCDREVRGRNGLCHGHGIQWGKAGQPGMDEFVERIAKPIGATGYKPKAKPAPAKDNGDADERPTHEVRAAASEFGGACGFDRVVVDADSGLQILAGVIGLHATLCSLDGRVLWQAPVEVEQGNRSRSNELLTLCASRCPTAARR